MRHLIPHVALKVLVRRDVHAHTPVLQPCGLDLVRGGGHRRDHHVGQREALLQRRGGGVDDVPGVIAPCGRVSRTRDPRPFGVFLD